MTIATTVPVHLATPAKIVQSWLVLTLNDPPFKLLCLAYHINHKKLKFIWFSHLRAMNYMSLICSLFLNEHHQFIVIICFICIYIEVKLFIISEIWHQNIWFYIAICMLKTSFTQGFLSVNIEQLNENIFIKYISKPFKWQKVCSSSKRHTIFLILKYDKCQCLIFIDLQTKAPLLTSYTASDCKQIKKE